MSAVPPLPAAEPAPELSGRRLAVAFAVPKLNNGSLFQAEFDHLGRVLDLRLLARAEGLAYPDTLAGDVAWLASAIRAATAVHIAQQLGGLGVLGMLADEVYAIERDSKLAIRDAYTAVDMAMRRWAQACAKRVPA